MKRLAIFMLFFAFLVSAALGETYTWVGGSGNNWNDEDNWKNATEDDVGHGFPGENPTNDTAIIDSSGVSINISATLNDLSTLTIEGGASLALSSAASFVLITAALTNDGTLTLGSQTVTATTITNNGTLTLDGNLNQLGSHTSIGGTVQFSGSGTTLSGITNFVNLTIQGGARTGAGAVSVSGIFILSGGSLNATSLSVTGTGTISENITTTGAQTYSGAVTLGANVNLTANTTNLITFGSTINGAYGLTITTANVQFSGIVGGTTRLASVNVTAGTSAVNANVSTTGAQTYTGAVTLNADRTFTANAGSLITFGSTVRSGNAIARALTITTANVRFDGAVGITGNPISTLSVNAGTAYINADINTSGTGTPQRYYGSVVLGANVNFTGAASSTIRFDGNVYSNSTGPYSLTVTNAILRFSVSVGVAPAGNTSLLSVTAGTLTATQYHRLVQGVTTTGNQTYNGNVRLGNTANTSVTLAAGTGTITFGGIVESNNATARALTINSGNVVFNGTVGVNGFPISTLIVNGTGTTTISAAVNYTTSVAINSTGTATINANVTTTGAAGQTYTGPVLLGNSITFTGAANSTVHFANTVNSNNATARSLTVTTANARFDGTVGGANPIAGVSVAGTSAINTASITTTGTQTYTGTVTLGGTAGELRTLTGTTVTMGAITGNGHALTIAGDAVFDGVVNGIATLEVGGNSAVNAANITTTGTQIYTGAVTLGGAAGSRTLTGTTVTMGAITGGGHALTIAGNVVLDSGGNNIGALQINGNATINGDITNTTGVTINTTGTSAINADITTTGNQTYTGAVTLTGTRKIESTGGNITTGAGLISSSNDVTIKASNGITIGSGGLHSATNITLESGGTVTQGGAIIAGTLTLAGNAGFTLANSGNNAAIVQTATPYPASITYTDTDDFNTGSELQAVTSITLTSGGDITAGAVSCNSLTLIATTGKVTIEENINVAGSGVVPGNHKENAPVYIEADELEGDGAITFTSGSGHWVCAYITQSTGFTGVVNEDGIHYHTTDGRHIVYRSGDDSSFTSSLYGNHPLFTQLYLYIQADNVNLHNKQDIYTIGEGNIYIIDVDNGDTSNPALTREASFSTESDGHIEIWGKYTAEPTGVFTLNSGEGGVVLIAADINLAGDFDTNDRILKISGTNSISAANITLFGGIEGTTSSTGTLSLEASSITSIEGNVGQSVSLGNLSVTGALALKNSTFTASAFSLDGPVTIDENVAFNGPVSHKGGITLNASAAVSFADAVTLAADTTFAAPSGGMAALTLINGGYLLTLNGGSASLPLLIEQANTGGIEVDGGLIIAASSYVKINSGSTLTQAVSKELTLETSAVLDTSAGSWHMGTAGTSNDFAGINGALNLDADSKLITHALNLTGSAFTITNSGWVTISVKGDVLIADDITLSNSYPQLIIEMDGNGTQTLTTEIPLGSLHVREHSRTVLRTNDASQTVSFMGEVKIFYGGSNWLDAGDYSIVMYAGLTGNRNLTNYTHNGSDSIKYARWENVNAPIVQPPYTSFPDMNSFIFRQNTGRRVSFQREPGSTEPVFFEIAGNTMWREFECSVPGAVVQFSRHPHHHVVLEDFSIGNKSSTAADHSDYVTITRLTDGAYINFPYIYDSSVMGTPPLTSAGASVGELGSYALPVYYPPLDLKNAVPQEKEKYWNINFVSVSGPAQKPLDNFRYVRIFFSHAYNQRIPIETSSMHLDAVPYYRPLTGDGHFNFDWIELRKILYSFTEDSSGDGRLDRIRVQTNVRLNGDFSTFEVNVEGYRIDTSKGTNGFGMVSALTGYNDDEDSFYIYLQQVPHIDGGSTPLWSVTRNESLKDLLTESSAVGDPVVDVDMRPFDTIPVRVAYTLTLPGHPQTYVKMSEPVISLPGGNISDAQAVERSESYIFTWKYFPYDSPPVVFTMPVISANMGYLLNMPSSFDIETLWRLKNIFGDTTSSETDGYFRMDNIIDQGQRAMDWHDPSVDPAFYIYYQPPKYPLNWGYTEYAKVYGNGHLAGRGLLAPDFSLDDTTAIKSDGSSVPLSDVFLPPNKMITVEMMTLIAQGEGYKVTPSSFASYSNPSAHDSVIRRVTDLLVSLAPASGDSENYFAWPVWARYQNSANPGNAPLLGDFWSQINADNGVIWTFDGAAFLEARGLELQARMNSGLTGNLELFWTTDIPTEYRIPQVEPVRGRSTGGLWLPYPTDLRNRLLYYFAPLYDGSAVNQANAASPANPPLFNFALNGENSNGKKMEFVFRINGSLPSDLFIARLDIPRTGAIPENWYSLVRPFGFDIQDIRLQRGGVTVLNNVINSDSRENAVIRYHIMRPGRVTIQVYTLDGTLVKSLMRNEYREAGEWTNAWDGTNNSGRAVARGIYFVRVVAPDIDEIRKIMVIR